MHPKNFFEQIKLFCRKSEEVLALSYLEESKGGGGVRKHPPSPIVIGLEELSSMKFL